MRIVRAMVQSIERRSRANKMAKFREWLRPTPSARILDIGVQAGEIRPTDNFFEKHYRWKGNVTAVGLDAVHGVSQRYPAVTFVQADALHLPFRNRSFDIAFSNAVVEHVGGASEQRQFISEMLRVADAVFVTTPDRTFPVDPHTWVPLAHWLPARLHFAVLRLVGRSGHWSPRNLRPLTARSLRNLFPPEVPVTIKRQRVTFLPETIIAVHDGRSGDAGDGVSRSGG